MRRAQPAAATRRHRKKRVVPDRVDASSAAPGGSIESRGGVPAGTAGALGLLAQPRKSISRAGPHLSVSRWNHRVSGIPGTYAATPLITCLRAPVRARSVIAGGRAEALRLVDLGCGGGILMGAGRWLALAEESARWMSRGRGQPRRRQAGRRAGRHRVRRRFSSARRRCPFDREDDGEPARAAMPAMSISAGDDD